MLWQFNCPDSWENNVGWVHLQYVEEADRVKNPEHMPQPHCTSGFSIAEGQSGEWKCFSCSAESGQLTWNSVMFTMLQALWHAFPTEQGEIPPGDDAIAVPSDMASSQTSAHKTFQSSRKVGMTELSWGICLWVDTLARIFGLWCHEVLASDWLLWQVQLDGLWCHEEVHSDGSSGQEIPRSPNPPQLSATWIADTGCLLLES
jgi:hypothetical protein